MNNREILKRAEQLKPFFPDGKAKFSLPDTAALTRKLTGPQPQVFRGNATQVITPREVIAPYYENAGGITQALRFAGEANRNYNKGLPVSLKQVNRPVGVYPSEPGQGAAFSPFGRRLELPATKSQRLPAVGHTVYTRPPASFSLPSSDVNLGYSTQPSAPGPGRFQPPDHSNLVETSSRNDKSYATKNHYRDPTVFPSLSVADVARHEVNHAVSFVPSLHLRSDVDRRGYFDRPVENDQGLANTKQETAALTGELVRSPAHFDQLLKEINPQDADESAFEKRISPYSPEGQRYWRYLRHNRADKDYYQQAIQRGRERMPLMVQLQQALDETPTKAAALYDFDGTLAPQIAGDAATYRKALRALGPDDLSPTGKKIGKNRVDIATARPQLFHADIRAAAKRMGLSVGDIHAAGFDKTDTIRKLRRPLLDNNPDVVAKIHAALGPDHATLVPTHEHAAKSAGLSSAKLEALLEQVMGLARRGVGRVVTNLVTPAHYDNKMSELLSVLLRQPGKAWQAVRKDVPLPFVGDVDLPEAAKRQAQTWWKYRDEPYRQLFDLPPREWATRYPKNPNGTFRLSPEAQEQAEGILAEAIDHEGPQPGYSVYSPKVLGNAYFQRKTDGSFHYRDPWDFSLHSDEKVDSVSNLLRAMSSKIIKPVTFEGELPPLEKSADSWLQRWLAMFAARDAAHQADPTRDSLATKLLGGPASLGLSEAINNHAIMGDTAAERRDSMRTAVDEVKEESYGDALLRGLKSSPSYMLAGAGVGAATPALSAAWKGESADPAKSLRGAGIGAASGLGLAVLRPLLQRAILGNTSNRAQRDAIATKARHPILTALPFGDMIGAAKSARRGVNRFSPAELRKRLASAKGEQLIGGDADGLPDSAVPAKALAQGRQHEAEHTDNPKIQTEIAKDHLSEDPRYYAKLEKSEAH